MKKLWFYLQGLDVVSEVTLLFGFVGAYENHCMSDSVFLLKIFTSILVSYIIYKIFDLIMGVLENKRKITIK